MNGEKKFLLVVFCLGLFSLVILVSWLFVAFWRWKELIALGLIALIAFVVLGSMTVMLLGALNEQALRRQRVLYHRELPLDAAGRPLYLPDTMRQAHFSPSSSSVYSAPPAPMSKHEQRAEHVISPAAQTTTVKHEDTMTRLPDDVSGILTIRPVPGHPFASVYEQGREAQHPDPSMMETETVATWANLEELAHEWGTFARDLAFLTSPASAHIFQAIGMAFLALSHEESAYAHYFLLGNRLRYPPSTIAEGLEQTGVDLHEAFVDWTAVGLWLERLANDGHTVSHMVDTVRPLVMQARAQQQRLWSLLLSIQGEHARLTKQGAAHKGGHV